MQCVDIPVWCGGPHTGLPGYGRDQTAGTDQTPAVTSKRSEYDMELPPPPEGIRTRWQLLLEGLMLDYVVPIELLPYELRFRREIVRWVMGVRGARVDCTAGKIFHAWMPADPAQIRVMRTR